MNVRMAGRYWFGRVGPSGYGFYTTAEQVAADHGAAVSGRVVLVTGAASGIGLETASVFAAHGATVFVTARSADKAEAAAKAVRARVPGANVRTLAIDLSNLKDVKRAANEFLALKSPLHILVNNAGGLPTGWSAWSAHALAAVIADRTCTDRLERWRPAHMQA